MDTQFQDRLNRLRRERGLSQEDLAEVVGVTRQAVQKWESGASRPDMDNLAALARYFGVTLDHLVLGRDPGTGSPPGGGQTVINNYYHPSLWEYEYKSERTLWGLPLVHIHLKNNSLVRAKGIIAVGNVAVGLVSAGIFSVGVLSFGVLALGVLALGCLAAGVLSAGATVKDSLQSISLVFVKKCCMISCHSIMDCGSRSVTLSKLRDIKLWNRYSSRKWLLL